MAETPPAGWAMLEVRAWTTRGDGNSAECLQWRGRPAVYPDLAAAVARAHSGLPPARRPAARPSSELRMPHPVTPNAVVVVKPPALWMVFPLPAGADRRAYSEQVFRSTPAEWLVTLLLPAAAEAATPLLGELTSRHTTDGTGRVLAVDSVTGRHVGDAVPSDTAPGRWRAVVIDPVQGFHLVCVLDTKEWLVDEVRAGTDAFPTPDEALRAISRHRLF
ncbi:hypothetical protein RM844_20980 [Streptomyces sp. DSM 44915]|uniref:Uncharacterized protein n=1 Tax=Streptomyces chisholmiae TaxID=3075540 RepID=A0ABU2JUV3_9ACTN|nr:hypothetical protein [Streptomyces sp. DSM 44915]MDT0268765.1 hypothetical protein [Streptomyces sp. DSM 44915]